MELCIQDYICLFLKFEIKLYQSLGYDNKWMFKN